MTPGILVLLRLFCIYSSSWNLGLVYMEEDCTLLIPLYRSGTMPRPISQNRRSEIPPKSARHQSHNTKELKAKASLHYTLVRYT